MLYSPSLVQEIINSNKNCICDVPLQKLKVHGLCLEIRCRSCIIQHIGVESFRGRNSTPYEPFGEVGRSSCPKKEPGFSGPAPKLLSAPCDIQKNYCPCFLEGHFFTNPILSAFHLRGPKSNIYIYTHTYTHIYIHFF